jgi:hypothetical protein
MSDNPYPGDQAKKRIAWDNGYQHGKAQCNHHPEALTDEGVKAIIRSTKIKAHQHGVEAGRSLEQDKIGEHLVLIAQEYGHAQFVFTADNLEDLNNRVAELSSSLASIETLR